MKKSNLAKASNNAVHLQSLTLVVNKGQARDEPAFPRNAHHFTMQVLTPLF